MDAKLSSDLLTSGDRNVQFPVAGKEQGQGYLSPKGQDSEYGIVVISEWWGLNKSICKSTDILAEQGFMAISPDVYRGKTAASADEANHLMNGLDWEGAVADVSAAAAFLRSKGCKKVGLTGFCMGGALTIAVLTLDPLFNAGAPFYGIPPVEKYDLSKIKIPILAQFGELDTVKNFSTPADALNFEQKCKQVGVNIIVKIWPGVGHAFMNQDSPQFNKKVFDEALPEVTAFFKKTFQV